MQRPTNVRDPAIDALRFFAFFLGIILHACIPFTYNHFIAWPIQNPNPHLFFDFIFIFIRLFRLPLFFLIAGFCAAQLYQFHPYIFLKNRLLRICVPFLLGMLLLTVWHAAQKKLVGTADFTDTGALWFLYYLIWFYSLIFLCNKIFRITFSRIFFSLTFFLLIAVSFLALLLTKDGYLTTAFSLIPDIPSFLFYGAFFFLGFFSFRLKSFFFKFCSTYAPYFLIVGMFYSAGAFCFYFLTFKEHYFWITFLRAVFCVISGYCLSLCILGFFTKLFRTPSYFLSYAADLCYWGYLIQIPMMILIQSIFCYGSLHLTPISQFFSIIATISLILWGTYHFFVRYHWIGWLLNGRRYQQTTDINPNIHHTQTISKIQKYP